MNSQKTHVVIGGEAGQGLVTVGELLSRCFVRSGYHILVTQSYMSRIRGGHNTFSICAGVAPINAPQEAVDILVALDDETVSIHRPEVALSDGVVVLNESSEVKDGNCLRVPFKTLTEPKYENVAALGVVSALLGLDKAVVCDAVAAHFGHKDDAAVKANRTAIDAAYTWAQAEPRWIRKLDPADSRAGRLMLNGNEAIALGALAAGAKFCAYYPMTPSTSVVLNLIKHADDMNLIVEQAEDEIAAINMAIGASFAGSRSMTATSGGGFALMTEGVSLSAMTETPLVIVVAQRPGPATGLPTRTEQADLEFILHAGHGEFPRAVFAPGSIEECFELMRRSFALAEASQGPVFLLTDQFLADSYRDTSPFNLDASPALNLPAEEAGTQTYQRYRITPSGVSPRQFPGMSSSLVVADSDEHDEDGHITEDLVLRNKMVEKRLRKLNILYDNVTAPEYDGADNPDILLISWGSSKGAVNEAAARLREAGKSTGSLHFSQVWPLVPPQFLGRLQSARRVICVEGNASGQFARLIRRESGFAVSRVITRFDGLPLTPDYIIEGIKHE